MRIIVFLPPNRRRKCGVAPRAILLEPEARNNDAGDAGRLRHDMLGMRLDYAAPQTNLSNIIEKAVSGDAGYCCIANVHQCVLAHDDISFREVVNAAAYVIPDSVILERARSLRHGVPFLRPLLGADLMLALCERAAEAGVPAALIGGRTEDALTLLREKLLARFPKLKIVFAWSPPFRPLSEAENEEMVAGLGASGARLVFVGLGCPKQERFMAAHSKRISAFMIGVGAAFDENAGVTKSSPPWVHKHGFEWLWRLLREPRRLWRRYLLLVPRFVWLLAMESMGRRTR